MTSGGIEWEQGAAVTRMVTALRNNDPDTMALAMADYAAALGTRTTSILSGIVTSVIVELQAMRVERSTDARNFDHKLDLILLANTALRDRIVRIEENTLSNVIGAEDRLVLIGLVRTIPDITERLARLEARRAE